MFVIVPIYPLSSPSMISGTALPKTQVMLPSGLIKRYSAIDFSPRLSNSFQLELSVSLSSGCTAFIQPSPNASSVLNPDISAHLGFTYVVDPIALVLKIPTGDICERVWNCCWLSISAFSARFRSVIFSTNPS